MRIYEPLFFPIAITVKLPQLIIRSCGYDERIKGYVRKTSFAGDVPGKSLINIKSNTND